MRKDVEDFRERLEEQIETLCGIYEEPAVREVISAAMVFDVTLSVAETALSAWRGDAPELRPIRKQLRENVAVGLTHLTALSGVPAGRRMQLARDITRLLDQRREAAKRATGDRR